MRIKKLKEERSVSPFFPDMLLPAQFFSDQLLVGKASGEMALRWAVFADGLKQYWKLAAEPSTHASPEFQEEEGWVLANDTEWPFSFTNLCEAFGLSPQSVRRVLVAWKNAHLTTLGQDRQEKKALFPSASNNR